jgi:hypothetical protein
MRGRLLLALGVLMSFGGCQACSDCTDYTSPVRDTAPGEMYAGRMLPAGQPVVPQFVPPGTGMTQPLPSQPTPAPGLEFQGFSGMPQPPDFGSGS